MEDKIFISAISYEKDLTEREKEDTYIKKICLKISNKLKLKRYYLTICAGYAVDFYFKINEWEQTSTASFVMGIMAFAASAVLAFVNIFSPDEQEVKNMSLNLKATQQLLSCSIDASKKYDNQIKALTSAVESLRDIGTIEFKEFVDNLKNDNFDNKKFKDILHRQKELTDKLSKTVNENEMILGENEIKGFAHRLKNFSEGETKKEIDKSNLSDKSKEDLKLLITESEKILNIHNKQINLMKNFSFHRKRRSFFLDYSDEENYF
jgi:hypothetical protein